MGIFAKILAKMKGDEASEIKPARDSEQETFYADSQDAAMREAAKKARQTFKYFWRELYWDRRRIVPALDMAMVKLPFSQDDGREVEYMWVDDVEFDGEKIYGRLVNEPDTLTNIKKGDEIEAPLDEVSDWIFVSEGKSFGAFGVQAMRSKMSEQQRVWHDEAWGVNFGDFDDILVVVGQKKYPQNLIEHPMSINGKDKFEKFIKENSREASLADENGYTLLHKEAIAGNLTTIKILLQNFADRNAQTDDGKTALEFASIMGWEHIVKELKQG